MKTPGELGKLFEQIAQPDAQGYSQAFSIEELAADYDEGSRLQMAASGVERTAT